MSSANVEEHRKLIPFSHFISSTGEHGSLMVSDVFIDPSKLDRLIELLTPCYHKMHAYPECKFIEMAQNPQDPAHIRYVHAWTKGTDWFREVSLDTLGCWGGWEMLGPMI
jgi:hypothetical protein